MAQSLLIVESPAKCDKIEKYLGAGYKCHGKLWTFNTTFQS